MASLNSDELYPDDDLKTDTASERRPMCFSEVVDLFFMQLLLTACHGTSFCSECRPLETPVPVKILGQECM